MSNVYADSSGLGEDASLPGASLPEFAAWLGKSQAQSIRLLIADLHMVQSGVGFFLFKTFKPVSQ